MWYKHLKLGPINSLSFSANTKDYQMYRFSLYYYYWFIDFKNILNLRKIDINKVENDATVEYQKFFCKNFLVNTNTGFIGYVTKSGTNLEIISKQSDNSVYGLACHPELLDFY